MGYLDKSQYDEVIFHHRLPTSTQNTLRSAHPFVIEISDKRYYFVHNGVIQNANQLKERHARQGIVYSSAEGDSFNDSEALAWDLCLWLSGRQQVVEAQGSVAFVCLAVDKKTSRAERLYFYRNSGAELKAYTDKTLFLLASEGNYTLLEENRLYFWDYGRRQIRRGKYLDIHIPVSITYTYDYSDFDEEIETEAVLDSLEQERDYLVSAGEYARAEEIAEEIEDIRDQLREKRDYLITP
jgi:predicted glutamine amidotransferase